MLRFILTRLSLVIPTFFGMTLLAFFLIRLVPGDPIAVKRNSVFDHGVMVTSLTGYSMPIFRWGLLLILLFSVQLGWTPVKPPRG